MAFAALALVVAGLGLVSLPSEGEDALEAAGLGALVAEPAAAGGSYPCGVSPANILTSWGCLRAYKTWNNGTVVYISDRYQDGCAVNAWVETYYGSDIWKKVLTNGLNSQKWASTSYSGRVRLDRCSWTSSGVTYTPR